MLTGTKTPLKIPIKTGLTDGIKIEITSGLKEEQKILDNGEKPD